jgi:hypothetical protein
LIEDFASCLTGEDPDDRAQGFVDLGLTISGLAWCRFSPWRRPF